MYWLVFFLIVFKASLFSTGGFGPLPSLHSDLLARNWASEKQFTEALTIGQITPGPNGLWVVSLCYLVAGLPGALLACLGILLPPLLVLIVKRGHRRIASHPATQGALDGVVLVIVSFSIIVLTQMFCSNGPEIGMVAITSISAVLAIRRWVSATVILAAAAVVGWIVG